MFYRVSYNFIGKNNALRASALVIDGKDPSEARRKAEDQLKKTVEGPSTITSVKPFQGD